MSPHLLPAGQCLKFHPERLLPGAPPDPCTHETTPKHLLGPSLLGRTVLKKAWFLVGACAPGGPETAHLTPTHNRGARPAAFLSALSTAVPPPEDCLRPCLDDTCHALPIATSFRSPPGLQGWAAPHSSGHTHCHNRPGPHQPVSSWRQARVSLVPGCPGPSIAPGRGVGICGQFRLIQKRCGEPKRLGSWLWAPGRGHRPTQMPNRHADRTPWF